MRNVLVFLRRRLFGLGPAYDELRSEIAELRHRCEGLASRQTAMQTFYEQRIDLIYRRVTTVLEQMLESRKLSVETPETVQERYRQLFSFGLASQVDLSRIPMDELTSGEVRRGVLSAPLTFHGFHVDSRLAIEEGDAIRVLAGDGIAVDGPHLRLAPGDYSVCFELTAPVVSEGSEAGSLGRVGIEVWAESIGRVVAERDFDLRVGLNEVSADFTWSADASRGKFVARLLQKSRTEFRVSSVRLS